MQHIIEYIADIYSKITLLLSPLGFKLCGRNTRMTGMEIYKGSCVICVRRKFDFLVAVLRLMVLLGMGTI